MDTTTAMFPQKPTPVSTRDTHPPPPLAQNGPPGLVQNLAPSQNHSPPHQARDKALGCFVGGAPRPGQPYILVEMRQHAANPAQGPIPAT